MKPALLALLIASAAYGQITCSTATSAALCPVTTGKTVVLTSPTSVTWTLGPNAVGTLSGTNPSTTITYNAPASVAPSRTLFGCQVMPMDSIFNTRIDGLPADPNSATKINNQNGGSGTPYVAGVNFQPSRGISYADSTNEVTSTQLAVNPLNGSYPGWITPTNQYWKREGGRYVGLTAGFAKGNGSAVDFHTMTVRVVPTNTPPTDCTFYESYQQLLNGTTSTVCSGSGCTFESAATYPTATYLPQSYGTGAAGTPAMPQQATPDELHAGSVKHRQRMTVSGRFLSNTYRWPATATAGGGLACDGGVGSGNTSNCVQLGDVYRLTASALSTYNASVCTSGSPAYQVECTAELTSWRNYGLSVDDTGTQATITPSSDLSEDPLSFAALNAIQAANIQLNSTNFEIVDQGPLMPVSCVGYATTPNSLYGCTTSNYGGNAYTGEQNNGYEQPLDLAVVCAGTCGGATAQISVAIQPVAIGVAMPNFFAIHAGSYTWTIPYYVTGTTTKTAIWAISGCSLGGGNCGSVTSSGVYTPPSSLSTGTIGQFTLTGTATADSASAIMLWPTVIPAASGTARIDLGSASDTGPDGNGNYWTRDIGTFGVTNVCTTSYGGPFGTCELNNPYPNTDPLYVQLTTSDVVGGTQGSEDFHYYGVLPNGKYNITVYETNPGCQNTSSVACGTWPSPSGRDIFEPTPILINVNGQTVTNAWDWAYSQNYLYASNGNITVPVNITNNFLDLGVYPVAPDVSFGNGGQLCNNGSSAGCVSPYTGTNLGTATGNKVQFLAALQIAPTTNAIALSIDPARNTLFNNLVAAGGSSQPLYAVCNYFTCGSTTWSIVSSPICGTGTGQVTCTLTATAWGDGGEELSLGSGTVLGGQPIIVQAVNSGHTAQLKFLTSGPKFLTIP